MRDPRTIRESGVLDLVSGTVGPAGEVVGLDNEPRMIALAECTLAERDLSNVKIVLGEASATGLAADSLISPTNAWS